MEEKQYGMTWLKIYTVLFVIRVISMTLSVLTVLTAVIGNTASDMAIAIFILLLIEYAFEIFTLVHFLKKTEFGYTINMVYIFLSTFISAFNVFFQKVIDQGFDATQFFGVLIASVVFLLAWSIPNYIYFKHRRYLFSGTLKEKNNSTVTSSTIQSANNGVIAATVKTPSESQKKKKADERAAFSVKDSSQSKIVAEPKKDDKTQKTIPVDELRMLKKLHDSGVLTAEEFEQKKKQLLGL